MRSDIRGENTLRSGLSFVSFMFLCSVVAGCDDAPSSATESTPGADRTAQKERIHTSLRPDDTDATSHPPGAVHIAGFDPAIANKERLIEMLRKTGRVAANATTAQAYAAVDEYLRNRAAQAEVRGLPVGDEVRRLLQRQREVKRQLAEQARRAAPPLVDMGQQEPKALEREQYDGDVMEPHLLALLVEFPDFPHNSIGPDETNMYYEDYSTSHYEELLFSPDTYEGPNGEALRTARNWYWAQSGQSYNLNGTVAGWFTATEPAAFYGGNDAVSGNDTDPRALVSEAVLQLAASTDIDLNEYDRNDPYDLDGDGDLDEPDGIIDHLLLFHSSVGEEAGGGSLAENAIWSHRWQLPAPLPLPGTETGLPYWDGQLVALGYTIQPADAAIGVVVHEHGHDIGLPDEYDTQYSGSGEPVGLWSAMSSGSWAGDIPGSKPTGMSPYARETLQTLHGGNWLIGGRVDAMDLDRRGRFALLDEASSKGSFHDYVRVDLPPKVEQVVTPPAGSQAYHSGAGDNLSNTMSYTLDLTGAQSARLQFQTWYDIELDWDYAYVQVDDGSGTGPVSIPGNLTTEEDPNATNLGHGITGASDWTTAEFDLSAYVGQQVEVSVLYQTDGAVSNPGMYIDEVEFVVDDAVVATDGAEAGAQIFTLNGFYATDGLSYTDHYYLLEWRSYAGVDAGLAERSVYGGQILTYNRGLVVWYVDDSFTENWVGIHPGQGFLGVVDADQEPLAWQSVATDEVFNYASTQLQIRDAAFSRRWSPELSLTLENSTDPEDPLYLEDQSNRGHAVFRDWSSYWNETVPHAGRKLDSYGLTFEVWYESRDRSVALIRVARRDGA